MIHDIQRIRATKDGNAYCIHLDDFINIQESPCFFIDEDSPEGEVLENDPISVLSILTLIDYFHYLTQQDETF